MSIAFTKIDTGNSLSIIRQWPAMPAASEGDAHPHNQYADKSVQISGVLSGATVYIEGSNDGTNWATLTDVLGAPLALTAACIKTIIEATHLIRPRVSGGDGSTAVDVTIYMKE